MKVGGSILVAALLAGLSGCVNYDRPVVPPTAQTPAERNFQALWQGGLDVLREFNFVVDRQDRRAGVITTLPLTARHWFEFWRPDAVRPFDVGEGTLQTIYRTARIVIRPAAPGADTFTATVEVQVARSDQPQVQISGTSDALSLFTLTGEYDRFKDEERVARRRARLVLSGEQPVPGESEPAEPYLVPLGRDAGLEARLAAEIAARVGAALAGR